MTMLPTWAMPMATILGRVERNHHQVAHSSGDVLIAARTDIGLCGLVRLDTPDLDSRSAGVFEAHPMKAQMTSNSATTTAAATSR
jgi:hypothetical protein